MICLVTFLACRRRLHPLPNEIKQRGGERERDREGGRGGGGGAVGRGARGSRLRRAPVGGGGVCSGGEGVGKEAGRARLRRWRGAQGVAAGERGGVLSQAEEQCGGLGEVRGRLRGAACGVARRTASSEGWTGEGAERRRRSRLHGVASAVWGAGRRHGRPWLLRGDARLGGGSAVYGSSAAVSAAEFGSVVAKAGAPCSLCRP